MHTYLILFRNGFISEFLKHRNTFLLWFVLLVPLVITTVTFLTVWADHALDVINPWRWYVVFNYKPYFHIFVFLQILLICHVNYIEHRNNTWKNLRVLSVPFEVVFFSKIVFAYFILIINVLEFYSFIMLSGYVLSKLRPELGFQDTNYWIEAFIPSCKFIAASASITSILYCVSYYVKSILVAIIIGLLGYVSAFVLFLYTNRSGYTGFPYAQWHPFNFSALAFDSFGTGNHLLNMEYVYYGFIGGVLLLCMHYLLTRYKSVI
ncbi:ABC transporter permease [Cytophagaceae bacterium YF14B1]|uniref:ABC transporter permease n=1 Tax=Xanthocytophaga flava TaxID=3048013 RepID=A0AAE3QZA0_9BACT|nr:ABC transporter permease [Xanthocytophaga flavus]MDJ1472970.1 ABC transporter permease [Xanthocytophaga flavus]MDJ1485484.1 ABC transporter permease [Xanthocytophaga flavus]